jgi:hypothetical protein
VSSRAKPPQPRPPQGGFARLLGKISEVLNSATKVIASIVTLATGITALVALFHHSLSSDPTNGARQDSSGRSLSPDPAPSATSPVAPSPSVPLNIKFDPVTQVPMCANFTGNGDVPLGRTLWLAVLTDTGKYYFKQVAVDMTDHKWTATKNTIGSPDDPAGTPFTIYAVLVDNGTDRLIKQGQFDGGVASLPDTVVVANQIKVVRSADRTECKRNSH